MSNRVSFGHTRNLAGNVVLVEKVCVPERRVFKRYVQTNCECEDFMRAHGGGMMCTFCSIGNIFYLYDHSEADLL